MQITKAEKQAIDQAFEDRLLATLKEHQDGDGLTAEDLAFYFNQKYAALDGPRGVRKVRNLLARLERKGKVTYHVRDTISYLHHPPVKYKAKYYRVAKAVKS